MMPGFDDYESYDALGLGELIRTKELSAVEVLDAAIERLEARNPALNAVVLRMDDEARALIEAGLAEGRLSGVPYMLKDLYVFYEGVTTTNGSALFADFVPDHHSEYTRRLLAAGMVIVGKTNTPELGLNASTEPALHGATRNPWDLERSAGGSSGGAAAAVAAGIVPAAHATDGGGSIRIPAANCGLFGLKPTRGRNTMAPDVGEGWSGLSTGHAATRTVRDSAAILDATHGPSPGDPYAAPRPAREFSEEVGADPGELRIALWTQGLNGEKVDPQCVAGAERAARLCESLGHVVEPQTPDVDGPAFRRAMRVIISSNVANALAMRSSALGREIEVGEVENVSRLFAEEGHALSGRDYASAVSTIHATGRQLARLFADYDVALSPTLADPPLPLGTLDMMSNDLESYYDRLLDSIPFTPLYNVTGCPAATLPLHWNDRALPVGVQIGAEFGAEATLLRLASQLEAAQPWADRRPPAL